MPIYEYFCEKCHHEFEELVFGDDAPSCPQCSAGDAQKLMSRPCLHSGDTGSGYEGSGATPAPARSKCAGCSGGNCATC